MVFTTRLAHVCTWDVPPNKMAKLCKVINYKCPMYWHSNHVVQAYLSNYRTSLPLNLSMPVIVPDSMSSLYVYIYISYLKPYIHPTNPPMYLSIRLAISLSYLVPSNLIICIYIIYTQYTIPVQFTQYGSLTNIAMNKSLFL